MQREQLPEGTDQIVDGAMETGGNYTSTSSGGGTSGSSYGGEASSGGTGGGTTVQSLKGEARDRAQSLKAQAGERARSYAEDGKARATSALGEFAQVINDTASTVDERLGSEYGEYARKTAQSVERFAQSLENKDVEELFNDARDLIRKSPAVAIGTAAAVGFALVRLVKAGIEPQESSTGSTYGGSTGTSSSQGSSGRPTTAGEATASDISVGGNV